MLLQRKSVSPEQGLLLPQVEREPVLLLALLGPVVRGGVVGPLAVANGDAVAGEAGGAVVWKGRRQCLREWFG